MALVLFFILSFSSIFACEIQLPHQLLVFNDGPMNHSLFDSKNCEDNAKNELAKLINGFEGRVASFQIQEMMSSKGHQVLISPQSIQVQQVSSIIREQLILPQGIQIKSAHLENLKNYLTLNPGDQVEVSCHSCLFGARQPLNLVIKGFDGVNHSHLITADFVKMVKALKLTTPVSAFSSFSSGDAVEEVYVEAIPHTDYILNKDSLRFYKTNKPLKAGEILKTSDLTAMNLVRAGLKTDVILENKMIRIKTQGISRQNGAIGEFVEVFQPQKNKKYQGKVIDNNKILVEL